MYGFVSLLDCSQLARLVHMSWHQPRNTGAPMFTRARIVSLIIGLCWLLAILCMLGFVLSGYAGAVRAMPTIAARNAGLSFFVGWFACMGLAAIAHRFERDE